MARHHHLSRTADHRYLRQLEWLTSVSRRLTETTTLSDVLDVVYEAVRRGLGYDRVGINLFDYEAGIFEDLIGTDAAGNKYVPTDRRMELHADSPIWTFPGIAEMLRGSPYYYTEDATAECPPALLYLYDGAPKHNIMVPLRVGERVSGMISVDNLTSGRPIDRSEADALISLAGYVSRAVENARLHEELQASEHRFRAIFASAPVGMAVQGIDNRYLLVNDQLCAMLGYTAPELLQMSWEEITHPDELETDRKYARRLRDGDITYFTREKRYIHKDGSLRWANLTVSALLDPNGKAQSYVIIVDDTTDRKREAEERAQLIAREQKARAESLAAREASRLKSEFLAHVSHELRTPLNGIIGFSEIVYDERIAPLAPANKEFVAEILNSSHHLLRLINEILDLARLEAGRMDFRPEPLDLAAVCSEVIGGLCPLSQSKNLTVDLEVAEGARHRTMDGHRLRQVLYNYLSNAMKFTPEGGRITLRVFTVTGHRLRIEVEDTGIGIPGDLVPALFQPFYQLDSGPGKEQAGAGLGLALTKQIVEAQGGRVGVTSAPGSGSVFFAELPADRRVAERRIAHRRSGRKS